MEYHQTQFLMHIPDGYSFRNTIGIIKSETDHATMIVSRDSVEISFVNTSKCAAHKIVLDPKEFTMYRYNIHHEGELIKEYPIAFETNEMFNTTKTIGRKDGIRIYWLEGDNKLNVQPIKMSTKEPGRAGASFVKILTMEHQRWDPVNEETEPNVRVQAKEFADICSQANTLKCTTMEIVGHPSAVTFKSILPGGSLASINRFVSQTDHQQGHGVLSDIYSMIDNLRDASQRSGKSPNMEELMTVRVPIHTVKAMSKIHNISPPGSSLKFYFNEGKPTKIESKISTYGTYIINLRNSKT